MLYYLIARLIFEDDVMPMEWTEMKRLEGELSKKFKITVKAYEAENDVEKVELCLAGFGKDPQSLRHLLDEVCFYCESNSNHRVIDQPHIIKAVDSIADLNP